MAPPVRFRELKIELPVREIAKELYDEAVKSVTGYLEELSENSVGETKEIVEAQIQIAKDPALRKKIFSALERDVPLLVAIADACDEFKVLFNRLGGLYAERISDLEDIVGRISASVAGLEPPGIPRSDRPFILVAEDLAPADTATLDPVMVLGIVLSKGGPTCHAAIIARSLEIPTVVAVAELDKVQSGDLVLVDGEFGSISVGVDELEAREMISKSEVYLFDSISFGPCRFKDGAAYQLLGNVGTKREIEQIDADSVDGVGLFRTEFLFLNRSIEPTIEEQRRYYSELFTKFEGKTVTVRTIDAGADKPLPFLGLSTEANPALGVRGFRVIATNRDVIERQLEAISLAESVSGAEVSVMAPMISTVAEAVEFVEIARSHAIARAGIMVEVPSAVLCAEELLDVCDFVSIGTNDLAQYLFAADRESPHLARLQDPWNSALLRAIQIVSEAGLKKGKPVSVCGEAAADPFYAAILVGLGVTSLSVGSASAGRLRAMIARCFQSELSEIASRALSLTDSVELKAFAMREISKVINR